MSNDRPQKTEADHVREHEIALMCAWIRKYPAKAAEQVRRLKQNP